MYWRRGCVPWIGLKGVRATSAFVRLSIGADVHSETRGCAGGYAPLFVVGLHARGASRSAGVRLDSFFRTLPDDQLTYVTYVFRVSRDEFSAQHRHHRLGGLSWTPDISAVLVLTGITLSLYGMDDQGASAYNRSRWIFYVDLVAISVTGSDGLDGVRGISHFSILHAITVIGTLLYLPVWQAPCCVRAAGCEALPGRRTFARVAEGASLRGCTSKTSKTEILPAVGI